MIRNIQGDIIYTSITQLNGRVLREHDIVKFVDKSSSKPKWLAGKAESYKPEIGKTTVRLFMRFGLQYRHSLLPKLGIKDAKAFEQLADEVYGYESKGGVWPEALEDDYESLTRLCLAVMAIGEGWDSIQFKEGRRWYTIDLTPYKA